MVAGAFSMQAMMQAQVSKQTVMAGAMAMQAMIAGAISMQEVIAGTPLLLVVKTSFIQSRSTWQWLHHIERASRLLPRQHAFLTHNQAQAAIDLRPALSMPLLRMYSRTTWHSLMHAAIWPAGHLAAQRQPRQCCAKQMCTLLLYLSMVSHEVCLGGAVGASLVLAQVCVVINSQLMCNDGICKGSQQLPRHIPQVHATLVP